MDLKEELKSIADWIDLCRTRWPWKPEDNISDASIELWVRLNGCREDCLDLAPPEFHASIQAVIEKIAWANVESWNDRQVE